MVRSHNMNGSATIMILLLMVGITIMAMTALKSTIALYELALERTEHVRQEKALEALVLYGIAAGYAMKEEPAERTYEFAAWPPPQGTYQGMVTILPQENEWKIVAKLLQHGKELCVAEKVDNFFR